MPSIKKPIALSGTVTLTASAASPLTIPVGGHNTALYAIVGSSTGEFSMNFTPSDTSEAYVDGQQLIPSTMIVGTAQRPFFLNFNQDNVPGLVVRQNSNIVVNVVDTSGAANTIVLAFLGLRLYD